MRKAVGKVSPILVMLTSRNDSDFESSNVSLKENKPDGNNLNSNDIDITFERMKEKFNGFRQTGFRFSKIYSKKQRALVWEPLESTKKVFLGSY